MIKAVLWDMDGTLVDSEDIAVEALGLAMKEAGLVPTKDLKDRVVGRSADEIYRHLVEAFGLRADPAEWERRKHHYYFAAIEALRGFDDAISTWRRLDEAGLRQAIVSNSDVRSEDRRATVGIACQPFTTPASRPPAISRATPRSASSEMT